MGKKRNKYFLKEKEIIRLKMKDNEINKAIGNQGWIELEKPVHHGFYSEFILRADIQRRVDVAFYQEALDACARRVWCKDEKFKRRNWKTKKMEDLLPELAPIYKEVYEKLSNGAKKFFVETKMDSKNWRYGYTNVKYVCILSYELVLLKSKAYITHRREHDNILYQMEAENEKRLYDISDDHPWGGYGYGRFWKRHEFKKEKVVAERELKKILDEEI